jgi:hypothetical protein
MRNLLFVLLFISITVLGCGDNKSVLENCADENFKSTKKLKQELLKKSYKKKLQNEDYYVEHIVCEKTREISPKTFDAKYQ